MTVFITADSQDMDISAGDSTPTSEASYSHSSTPTTQLQNSDGPILLSNALPRLASHPATPTNSQLHFTAPSIVSAMNTSTSCTVSSAANNSSKLSKSIDGTNLSASTATGNNNNHMSASSAAQTTSANEMLMNSNAPGPPTPVTLANLPKILSQITGNKQIDQTEMNPQKALQTINNALLMSSRQQHSSAGGGDGGLNQIANNNNSTSLREHALNSPLYNLPHNLLNHSNLSGGGQYVQSNASGMISTQATGLGMGISSQFSAAGLKADGSSTLLIGDGPPTPTQELDIAVDHRKRK